MPRKSLMEKMEEAAGINSPPPEMPYKKGEYIKPGETARTWTGEKSWREKKQSKDDGHAKPL